MSFDPTMSLFHFGLKERKMSVPLELDLKNFYELRLDVFKKVLHFIRVMDQGNNRLVQVLEIDQSIDCPHMILRSA
jgi:hypothetical protein